MSDLIRRETVIDVLKQTGIIVDNDLGHLVIEEIHRIPTAYDIDKVVAELESDDRHTFDGCINKRKAIEIVKQGGVSDDVCECVLLNGHQFLHETSCGNVFDMQNGFKYCPYCSKKIKVVE